MVDFQSVVLNDYFGLCTGSSLHLQKLKEPFTNQQISLIPDNHICQSGVCNQFVVSEGFIQAACPGYHICCACHTSSNTKRL